MFNISAILLDYIFPTLPFIDSAINERLRQRAHLSSTIGGYNTHLKPKMWEFFSLVFSLFCYFSEAFCRGGVMSHPHELSRGDFVAPVAAFSRESF